MTLREEIEASLKRAMRDRDEVARETLRMLLSGLKNRQIELGRELEESEALDVLMKAVKSRQDSAAQYEAAGRADLAEKERAEIAVIEGYLPRQMTPEEVETAVKAVIDELGATAKSDLGKVMKAVMGRHKGQVDGKAVSRIAGQLLS